MNRKEVIAQAKEMRNSMYALVLHIFYLWILSDDDSQSLIRN